MKEKDKELEDEKDWKDCDNYQWRRWKHHHYHHGYRRKGGGVQFTGWLYRAVIFFIGHATNVLGWGIGLFPGVGMAGIFSLRSPKKS